MHLVMVDDDRMVLRPLLVLLTRLGHTVSGAENGERALQLIEEEMPDILVSDIRMSPIDGFQLIDSVRDRGIDLPTILISGYIDEYTRRRAARQGVRALLPKPVEFDQLLPAIEGIEASLADGQLSC